MQDSLNAVESNLSRLAERGASYSGSDTAQRHYARSIMKLLFPLIGAAFLLVAPQAHADEGAFIADLQAQGVPTGWPFVVQPIAGTNICTELHNGATPQSVVQQFAPIQAPYAPTIVATAQRDICPDTLH